MSNKELSNFTHSCSEPQLCITEYRAPLSDLYSPDELSEIVRFYVLQAPIAKTSNGTTKKESNLRNLSALGWSGNGKLNSLERKLLNNSSISSFNMVAYSSLTKLLKDINLSDEICPVHPRALVQRPAKLTLNEDGTISRNYSDSNRMQCLFRHLRNGIAHSQTYLFPNAGTLLIEDHDANHNITARLLLKKQTLLDWIQIVEATN